MERTNADKLLGSGTVHGVKGIILLPDGCEAPSFFRTLKDEGVNLSKKGYTYSWQSDGLINIYTRTYSDAEWSQLEAKGAVFLPAAGESNWRYSGSKDVNSPNSSLVYWSTSNAGEEHAESIYFSPTQIIIPLGSYRLSGLSVRLVSHYQP